MFMQLALHAFAIAIFQKLGALNGHVGGAPLTQFPSSPNSSKIEIKLRN